jgi:GTP-binding protein
MFTLRRHFCDRAKQTAISNRKEFMAIEPDIKVLDHLDHLGLGYVSNRRSRQAMTSKYENELPGIRTKSRVSKKQSSTDSVEGSPYPFNKGAKKVKRIVSAKLWNDVRDFDAAPEVAIIGRSNVGKSTLLNAILGYNSHVQKAIVSDKPGETRSLQFFGLGKHITTKGPTFVVADMPGYGFAFMNEVDAEQCFNLVRHINDIILIKLFSPHQCLSTHHTTSIFPVH